MAKHNTPTPKNIPVEDLLRLRNRMVKHSDFRGYPSPEDIASLYVLRLLEGYHSKATVAQAYIDLLRLETGRVGQPGHDAHRSLNTVATPEAQEFHYHNDVYVNQGLSTEDLMDLENKTQCIKGELNRKILDYHLLGWSQKDIAETLGYSAGRINQLLQDILEQIVKA